MFGEKLIIGKSSGKIDNKNRIAIPSFTFVEVEEGLIIQIVDENKELELNITTFRRYENILERFIKLRNNATSLKEYEKYDREISLICQKLDYLCSVDKQKRILIPSKIMKILNWNNTDTVEFIGSGESLLVRKK